MKCMSEHTDLISSYQLLITAACTNTGGKMKGSHPRAADRCPFVLRHILSQVTSFMQLRMLWGVGAECRLLTKCEVDPHSMVRAAPSGLRFWLTVDHRTNDSSSVCGVCEAGRLRIQIRTMWLWKIDTWFIFSLILYNTTEIIIIFKWKVLFVEKNIFGNFFEGSRISHRRHVNTTENAMSSTDIFISNWFDVCWWSNISKTILSWNGLLVLFVLLAGFPWNMARPQLHLSSLTVKKLMSSLVFHIVIPKTSNIRHPPSFDLLTDEFSKGVSIVRRALY